MNQIEPTIENPTRPILRYHGGKWKLAEWIISYFPAHRIYVEPFAGAASVLLRKPRAHAEVYNDMADDVVNLFRVLRDEKRALELRESLRLTPFARAEYTESFEPSIDPVEEARRLIVRSFMGYSPTTATNRDNTGFRTLKADRWRTPAHDWVSYYEALPVIIDRLRGITIENRPAIQVMRQYDTIDTLHYCDPPYPHATRALSELDSYQHEMTDDDHRELAGVLHSLKGMVVLSGYACDLYDKEMYPDWQRVERNALADGARPRVEVLWLNALAVQGLENRQNVLSF